MKLDGGQTLAASAVLLSMGVDWRRLNANGLEQLLGRGVFYGASRGEAFAVRGKRVFLVGGGNSAGQAAVFLAGYAEEVRILVRGNDIESTLSKYLVDQLAAKRNVFIETNTWVSEVAGSGYLESITISRRSPSEAEVSSFRDADALFIMIGGQANTDWLPAELERDERGFVLTGRDVTRWEFKRRPFLLETNLPNLFCAGDVRHDSVKRVASGVGEGSMAIFFIHKYLAL